MPSGSPFGITRREAHTNNVDFGCQRAPFFVSGSSGHSSGVRLDPENFSAAPPPLDRA